MVLNGFKQAINPPEFLFGRLFFGILAVNMKKVTSSLKVIYSLYVFIIFSSLTILSALGLLIILPFGKEKLGNRIYKICRYWSKLFYLFAGIRHKEIYESYQNSDFDPHFHPEVAPHNPSWTMSGFDLQVG